ncbi:zinc finger CCCH domain-containing protein 62-like isoform X2 [Asparagus officinalis]|uniref:zinc finger CCCH domain-containing protein 62-like isoform X2 n=1 Tax=Asparagus officinalis TaxID=4686 RepID=UPI00098E2CFE|nr:zinc finger CCCH domain-containing protein 62-like isoform X2 [Asparagus officinalis]
MANIKLKTSTQEELEIPEEDREPRFDDFCSPDDSGEDPTFDIVEETRSKFSKISVKKSRPRKAKNMDLESEDGEESFAVEIPELNEKDEKCFEKVEELIKDDHLEKLKLEQCKVYLRKYGLRLTGTKGILIDRIKEHLEVINGGGEMKYPRSSFVLNCKGDACTGDIVMFEQNVYEMFSIASRSATGPPCGTRVVIGRIVKESYGAAKQQHTFTIEVLWSTGEKPLPPLHPLLIKGRNLYRLKTMRQRWADEEERRKVLQEKHSRGFVARCSRETRIKEKEMRKTGLIKRKESKTAKQSENSAQAKVEQHHHQDEENNGILQQNIQRNQQFNHQQMNKHPINPIVKQNIQHNQQFNHQQMNKHQINPILQWNIQHNQQFNHQQMNKHPAKNVVQIRNIQHQQQVQHLQKENFTKPQDRPMNAEPLKYQFHDNRCQSHFNNNHGRYQLHHTSAHHEVHYRQPIAGSNYNLPRQQNWAQPRQLCRYYHQGSCFYGESCKYLHQ